MCGRFGWFHAHGALTESLAGAGIATVDDTFGEWRRFNVAPTANAQIVVPVPDSTAERAPEGLRGRPCVQATFARWGLVPAWVRDPATFRASTFNARSEGVADKPVFRDAFVHGRCLVPVSAFYEWRKPGVGPTAIDAAPGDALANDGPEPGGAPVQGTLFGGVDSTAAHARRPKVRRSPSMRPQAVMIRRVDRAPIWLAGLHVPGRLPTFTIVTTSANPFLASVHARQPVILEPERLPAWIDPRTPRDLLELLMQPSDPARLEIVPIGEAIGQATREGEDLVQPTGEPERWRGADDRPPWNARE